MYGKHNNIDLEELKDMVYRKVDYSIIKLEEEFGTDLFLPDIVYDLKGQVAGQANSYYNKIRLNLKAFEIEFEDMLEQTVPHEVCHLYARTHNNDRRIKPHGREWKACMEVLGLKPSRCHTYGLEKARAVRRWAYYCDCDEICGNKHNVSTIIHNRIKRGRRYRCGRCKQTLLTKREKLLMFGSDALITK